MSTALEIPKYREQVAELINELNKAMPADKMAVFNQDAAQLAKAYPTPLRTSVGEQAHLFELPDAAGNRVSLADLLQSGPVVLTFYRGIWCPYCNLQLKTYQQILPEIIELGGRLVAVSPMTPQFSEEMTKAGALAFDVLSDVGNQVAQHYTTVFTNAAAPIQAMKELGYDFNGFYGDDSATLPVPATFVIAMDGRIAFAHSSGGDYRQRAEPEAILATLTALSAPA